MGGRSGKGGPAPPHAFGEALLFATMCIVGLPVEVQVKDGSVYSGIFHTASVEKEYGIVLKKARMIVKGRYKGNLGIGAYIDTIVVHSDDLVQVIAKGLLLPVEGIVVDAEGDGVEAVTGPIQSPPCDAAPARNVYQDGESTTTHFLKPSHSNANAIGMPLGRTSTTKTSETAYEVENGKRNGMCPEKVVVASHVPIISVSERQAGECKSEEEHTPCSNAYVVPWEKAILPGNCSSNSSTDVYVAQVNSNGHTHLDISTKIMPDGTCSTPVTTVVKVDSDSGMATSRTISSSNVHTPNHSTSTVHAKTMSCPSSSEMSILSAFPRNLTSNTGNKEFKLNPRAKTFSPSFANARTVVPAVSTVASTGYLPNTYTVLPIATAQPGIDTRPSANCTSAQTKFIQHNNTASGSTGHVSQFSHPITGLTGIRHQPPRLSGQYNPVQTGPTYLFPNSQIVTVGRRSQVMYLHPASQDSIQGIPTFTQAPPHSLLAPYPTNLPKLQGSATPTHFCVTQPIFPAGQQLPTMPVQIPYSNPLPSIQPIHVPGGSNIFLSKF